MSPPSNLHLSKFNRIEQLISTGEINEALKNLKILEQREELSSVDHLTCCLLKSRLLTELGEYEESLRLAETVFKESQEQKTKLTMVDALIIMAETLYWLGRYDEALIMIEQGEHTLELITRDPPAEVSLREAALLYQQCNIYLRKGELDLVLEYSQQSLTLGERLNHKRLIAEALKNLGTLYSHEGYWEQAYEYFQQGLTLAKQLTHRSLMAEILNESAWASILKGDLDQTIEYAQQSLTLSEKLNHKSLIAWGLWTLGLAYWHKGDWKRVFEYGKQSLTISKQLDHKLLIAFSLFNLGMAYKMKGELKQALDHIQQSQVLFEQIDNQSWHTFSMIHLGDVYRMRGELERALEHFKQCLNIYEDKFGLKFYKIQIAFTLENLGITYLHKGDLDHAMAFFDRGLTLREEVGNNLFTADTLFYLITTAIDHGSLEPAQRYLQRLQQLNAQEDIKLIRQYCNIVEAKMLLKTSSRSRSRVKAEELLEQVATEEVVEHQVTVVALLNLCDLLLTELRVSGDLDVMDEIHSHLDRLLKLAQEQHSHWLLAEIYVLQSKLALLQLDLADARRFLDQAQRLAEEWGLQRLAQQISAEHDILLDQLGKWEVFVDQNASLAERADLAQLEEQVVRMIRKRVDEIPEPPEEEPELLLIVGADSGLRIFSKTFQTDRSLEDHLIAGFLTAINAFLRDAFATTGAIERIKHAEHTLLLKTVGPFLICYIFQGSSYFALQKLNQFAEALPATTGWQVFTDALQTRRVITEEESVELLVTEVFCTPIEWVNFQDPT